MKTTSFSLKKRNRQRENINDPAAPLFTWEERAYERLKVLYGAGKILSSFDNVEKMFPEILSLCDVTFPFVTAVLIAKRAEKPDVAVWHTGEASQEKIDLAIAHAKESFIYFSVASEPLAKDLREETSVSDQLQKSHPQSEERLTQIQNYICLPLCVDHLPAFGVVQLEGSVPLDEKDIEFVDALASLIAISVDRFFKTKNELALRALESIESSSKLALAQAHVIELEAERELRERFVSMLSHDLRTPLSAVKLNAQMIQRQAVNAETTKTYASRIVNGVDRADQMITDLLDANRIRSGEKLPLQIEKFDLSTLMKATIHELALVHGDRFILKITESIEGHWDSKGVRRVLENLCNNAIKYGARETPVTVSVYHQNENAIIEVQNHGDLISQGERELLFQQFRRGRKINPDKKGWGIGLTLVRGVIEAHGGTVTLSSDADTGTIFRVVLPIDTKPFVPIANSFEPGLRNKFSGPLSDDSFGGAREKIVE